MFHEKSLKASKNDNAGINVEQHNAFRSKSVKIGGLLCWSLLEPPEASWSLLGLSEPPGVSPGVPISYYTVLCYTRLYDIMVLS